MDEKEWKDFLVKAGVSEEEAKGIADNANWEKVVEIVANTDGPQFFLSTYSGKVYELENGKLLYY